MEAILPIKYVLGVIAKHFYVILHLISIRKLSLNSPFRGCDSSLEVKCSNFKSLQMKQLTTLHLTICTWIYGA